MPDGTPRLFQYQATDIAVFGLSVAFMGFMAMAMGDMAAGAMGANRTPVFLPATHGKRESAWQITLAETHDAELEERVRRIIEGLQQAVDETKKADSIRRIERLLNRIDTEMLDREIIVGLDDLQDAIEEYRGIEREGLTPEEYQEEKEAAFETITEAVNDLDIDEDAMEEVENTPSKRPPADVRKLRQFCLETLDQLIRGKKHDAWPVLPTNEARKAVYEDILGGFQSLAEAREYIEGQPEDNVVFTARGDEIPFLLIRIVIDDIERNPWLLPLRAARPDIGRHPPLMPATIPIDDLQRIAGRYG